MTFTTQIKPPLDLQQLGNLATFMMFATAMHGRQTDKQGMPYIFHPMRVMLHGKSYDEFVVGLMHDLLEDTDTTTEDLDDLGLSGEQIKAVVAISRHKDETYKDYIDRVLANPLATRVKINDARDNLRPGAPDWMYPKYHELITLLEKHVEP